MFMGSQIRSSEGKLDCWFTCHSNICPPCMSHVQDPECESQPSHNKWNTWYGIPYQVFSLSLFRTAVAKSAIFFATTVIIKPEKYWMDWKWAWLNSFFVLVQWYESRPLGCTYLNCAIWWQKCEITLPPVCACRLIIARQAKMKVLNVYFYVCSIISVAGEVL